jgi:hypothetical protein
LTHAEVEECIHVKGVGVLRQSMPDHLDIQAGREQRLVEVSDASRGNGYSRAGRGSWPPGSGTAPKTPDVSRAAAMRLLGNGGVPHRAPLAIRLPVAQEPR